jgi:hypothetical protein
MANYGVGIYGASKYGVISKIAFSVEAMDAVALDFTKVAVSWQTPTGDFSRIRLVRNQNTFSEHPEDGITVWEEYVADNNISKSYLTDGGDTLPTVPITSGKAIYYTMYLFTSDKIWVVAGTAYTIVPSDHGLSEHLLNILPRVYTTKEQSPIGEPDTDSVLAAMLDGFGFTLEEFITFLDLINPDHTLTSTPAPLIPLERSNFGLTPEQGLPIRNQKALIREAIYLYTRKGTALSLGTYIEALTSYPPTLTIAENKMLTVQDSTFYKGIGNWVGTNATISAVTEQVPISLDKAIDNAYTGKVITSNSSGVMNLGTTNTTRAVPITPGKNYMFSGNIKSPASAGNLTPSIKLYDRLGQLIGSAQTGTAVAANNTWKSFSMEFSTPKRELATVILAEGDGTTMTYSTLAPHTLKVGATVTVEGLTTSAFNVTDAEITEITEDTFSILGSTLGPTEEEEIGSVLNDETSAYFAGLTLAFSAAGTYYVDHLSVQEGTTVTYDEARSIDIFLGSNKTNLINNPSFENNVTDSWSVVGATVTRDSDVATIAVGTKSAKVVATGNWSFTSTAMPINVGLYYSVSSLVKTTAPLTIQFIARDLEGDIVEDEDVYNFGTQATWAHISATDLTDALNEDAATYEVVFKGGAGTFYIDNVQFELGYRSTDYFDGSMPTEFSAVWEGDEHDSPTHVYYSMGQKITRLAKTLQDWVPLNSMWRLRSHQGVESNSLTV